MKIVNQDEFMFCDLFDYKNKLFLYHKKQEKKENIKLIIDFDDPRIFYYIDKININNHLV